MEALEHPDSIYLSAAQGWLELGNTAEAARELNQISLGACERPEVLQVRWQVAVKQLRWPEALAVAEAICRVAPQSAFGWIHRSYCLHELKRTQEAWDLLLPVADRFQEEWLVCYNLACYGCQLGHLTEGQAWFKRALQRGDPVHINRLAAEDPDLRPLFQPPA
jgi:tetratricopeptide (TPR) repeat protein